MKNIVLTFFGILLCCVVSETVRADFVYDTSFVFGNTGNDAAIAYEEDSSGNRYMTGVFSGTVDFDTSAGTANKTSNGNQDVFIVKYNSSNVFQWVKTFGSTSQDYAYDLTLDSSGNIYVIGYFYDTVDFDPGAGTQEHTSNGNKDGFLLKLNSAGEYQFSKSIGGTLEDRFTSLNLHSATNELLIGGTTRSASIDFDPGAGTDTISFTTGGGGFDYSGYLTIYDTSGNYSKTFDIDCSIDCNARAVGKIGSNYIFTGYFKGDVDLDPGSGTQTVSSAGSSDTYIVSVTSSKELTWYKTIGSTSSDVSYSGEITDSNSIVISGEFGGTVDFDPGAGTNNLTGTGTDGYVLQLDSSGDFMNAFNFGGTSYDIASYVKPVGSDMYIVGFYMSSNFDGDPTAGSDIASLVGVADVYLTKMSLDGTYSWTKTWGGTGFDLHPENLFATSSKIVVFPQINSEFDIDPGSNTVSVTPAGDYDAFYIDLRIQKPAISGSFTYTYLDDESVDLTADEVSGSGTVRISKSGFVLADVVTTFSPGTTFDWSSIEGDASSTENKAYISNVGTSDGTASTFTMYVPKGSGSKIRICPEATSLSAVTIHCPNSTTFDGPYPQTLSVGSESVAVSQVTIGSTAYWKAVGVSGTGGISLPQSGTTSSTSQGRKTDPYHCANLKPAYAPELFQIDRSRNLTEAIIYFSPVIDKTTHYTIMYGHAPFDEQYATGVVTPQNGNRGVQSYTISSLNPADNYYFLVIANNGCASTHWNDWETFSSTSQPQPFQTRNSRTSETLGESTTTNKIKSNTPVITNSPQDDPNDALKPHSNTQNKVQAQRSWWKALLFWKR